MRRGGAPKHIKAGHQHRGTADADQRHGEEHRCGGGCGGEKCRAGNGRQHEDRHGAAGAEPVEGEADRKLGDREGSKPYGRRLAKARGVEAKVATEVGGDDGEKRPEELAQHIGQQQHKKGRHQVGSDVEGPDASMRGLVRQPAARWATRVPRITDRLQTEATLCCIAPLLAEPWP